MLPFIIGKNTLVSIVWNNNKITFRCSSGSVKPNKTEFADGIAGETRDHLGAETNFFEWDLTGKLTLAYPLPWRQVSGFVHGMINTVSALVSPKSDIKPQHLGGPVQILRVYYLLFQSPQGWRLALWFSVFMNVNLAILNLLPVPMLDGGHILLGITEWIRRRPLSEPLIRWVQTAGAVVVLGFLLYVTSFDLGELIRGARKGPVPEKITFETTPPNPPAPSK